jgi:UDPglucose 6-dehydrogenase
VLTAVEAANDRQKHGARGQGGARFGEDLTGRRFAIWGLAFKPNTDDMREAPSRVIVEALLARGATLCAYDPVAMPEAKRVMEGLVGMRSGRPASCGCSARAPTMPGAGVTWT